MYVSKASRRRNLTAPKAKSKSKGKKTSKKKARAKKGAAKSAAPTAAAKGKRSRAVKEKATNVCAKTFSKDAIDADPRRKARWQRFEKAWSSIQRKIDACLEGVNSRTFDSLATYLKTQGHAVAKDADYIRAALLQTGLNIADHDLYCEHLCAHLRKHRTASERAERAAQRKREKKSSSDRAPPSLVARVPLGIKSVGAALHHITGKLSEEAVAYEDKVNQELGAAESDDHSASSSSSSSSRGVSRAHTRRAATAHRIDYSLNAQHRAGKASRFALPERWTGDPAAVLTEWYHSSFAACKTPPLIVIVIEDPSRTPRRLLQALLFEVRRLREHAGVACALVLCMSATADNALHGLLPARVVSFMQIRKFELRSSYESFESVVKSVVLDLTASDELMLGAQAARYLMDSFVQSSFSVTASVRLLHFCFLQHFKAQELSFSLPLSKEEIARFEPAKEDAVLLLALPSVRKLSRPPGTAEIRKFVTDFQQIRKLRSGFVFMFMSAIQDVMRGGSHADAPAALDSSKKQQFDEFSERRMYPVFFKPIKERTELLQFWKRFDSPSVKPADLLRILTNWRQTWRTCMSVVGKTEHIDTVIQEVQEIVDGKSTQRKLTGRAARKNILRGSHVATRARVKQVFQTFESTYLKPFSAYPLHEVFVFDDSAALRKSFEPEMMHRLRDHLQSHEKVFSCTCCDGSAPGSEESLNVAYRLMTESNRLINLFDWFDSFRASYENEDDEETQTQVIFRDEVDALKLLGLLKPARRADHVERLALKIT